MNTKVQQVDIGQCRRVRIRCISETSWFDTNQILADIKHAGGMSASQYAVGWTETNRGGYSAPWWRLRLWMAPQDDSCWMRVGTFPGWTPASKGKAWTRY